MATTPKMNKGKKVKLIKTGETGTISAVRNEGRGDWFDVKISTGPNPKKDYVLKSFRRTALELVQ